MPHLNLAFSSVRGRMEGEEDCRNCSGASRAPVGKLNMHESAGNSIVQDSSQSTKTLKQTRSVSSAAGYCVRQACQSRHHPIEAQAQPEERCRRESRKEAWRPPRSQLLLGESGLDLHIPLIADCFVIARPSVRHFQHLCNSH